MMVDVDASADDHELCPVTFAFQKSHAGFRLQRCLMVNLGLETRFDNGLGILQCLFAIALDLGLSETEVGPLVVDLNGIMGHGFPGIG